MGSFAQFIDDLQQQGRYHFTTQELSSVVGREDAAVLQALHRLKSKGRIASPQRGFHVVVPPEYRALGCLPAEQFIPQLMDHVNEPYYVALLSAAQLHGAAHQRPQRFQVMVRVPRRPIVCGEVSVEFHVRSNLEDATTVVMNTPRGHLRVASPETTSLELVGYQRSVGGLDNVATVLAELAEALSSSSLVEEAKSVPVAWVQRLGFLLELVEQGEVVGQLRGFVRDHGRRVVPLDPALPRTGAPRSRAWRVAINTEVEPDL
jgi:predicted transcriptional regulator of viral defense system